MLQLLLPVYDLKDRSLTDGTAVAATSFCRDALASKQECRKHYEALAVKAEGFYQCPFGFTSRNFQHENRICAVTGVVAFPRFGSPEEREKGRRYPTHRVDRASMDLGVRFLRSVEEYRANAIQEAAKVLPQAFHELRKLNGAVLQHAEREIKDRGESKSLLNIKGAAELMRNNFDILEALSNIEGMRALPLDSTVNVFELALKMKGILGVRAADRGMHITVQGERIVIRGSQKSFPIVPAVLLENAIKYGRSGGNIRISCQSSGPRALLTVENESDGEIDPVRCFERGARFSPTVEGGGFGLYLAREVVRAHNGTIRCETDGGSVRMLVETPLHALARK